MGFFDFTAGDVLTAAQVDEIMRQTVMRFTSDSDRDTQLSGNLEEGMHAYTTDNNRLYFYTGAAWTVLSEPIQTWTPTVSQPAGVSGTVNRGWYQRSHGTFKAQLRWTASAAGTTANAITVSLPFTLASTADLGGNMIHFVGGVNAIPASVLSASTTTAVGWVEPDAAPYGVAGGVEIASGDVIYMTLSGTL